MKKTILGIFSFSLLFASIFIENTPKTKKFNDFKKLSKAARLIEAHEWELFKTRDPATGKLPDNIKALEIAFSSHIPTKNSFFYKKAVPEIQTAEWTLRGPSNIAGRMLSATFDSRNDRIINAGGASGGSWQSVDGGVTWTNTTPKDGNYSVSTITQDKRIGKNDIWYFGTGELLSTTNRKFGFNIRTLLTGNGIYKSIDNGKTWNVLPSTVRNDYSLSSAFQGVWKIVADINNTTEDVILAACYGGILRSSDGGNSWTKVLGDPNNLSFGADIIQTPNGKFYAGLSTYTTNGKSSTISGIYASDNGINWKQISLANFSPSRVIKLAYAPSNENIVYCFIESPKSTWDPVNNFQSSNHYFWKYTFNKSNGTGVWDNRSANLPKNVQRKTLALNSLGGYAMALTVKPDDENIVVFGGTSLYLSKDGLATTANLIMIGGYFFSDWGGATWDIYGDYLHPDIHTATFSPLNKDLLIVGSDGGLHKTINCTDTPTVWTPITKGLITSQFYSVGLIPDVENSPFLTGGLQDNASAITTSNDYKTPWTSVIGGDGMSVAVGNKGDFSLGTIYNGMLYSVYYNKSEKKYTEAYQTPDTIYNTETLFFTSMALEPNKNDELYMPVWRTIWQKSNFLNSAFDESLRNENWTPLVKTNLPDTSYICSISISKKPGNILFYGTTNGRLFRLDNCNDINSVPTEITDKSFPKNSFLAGIEVDKDNADNLMVVFSNYNVQSIFFSSDGGDSWTTISGNLEENPDGTGNGPSVRCAKIVNYQGYTLYLVGTSTGLYSTTKLNGMNTVWVKEGPDVIGNVIVDQIDARNSDGTIAIATQGHGIISANIANTPVENESKDYEVIVFPNPVAGYCFIQFRNLIPQNISISVYSSEGVLRKQFYNNMFFNEGNQNLKLNLAELQSGAYFIQIQKEDGTILKKLSIIK